MIAYTTLTAREKYIYQLIIEVNHDSIWGEVITWFKSVATPYLLRELIEQLTEETAINPEAMATVIGDELVEIFTQGVSMRVV